MAGLGDEDEFRDEDGAGTAPPPSSSPASRSKADAAAGGFGRRLLASIGLPTSFSAAIGRPAAPPSSPKPPAPQPPAGPFPQLGLGLLLHQGPSPFADGSPVSDASARNLHLPPTADLQKQHGEVLGEQGAAEDGEDQVIAHDVGLGEELSVLVPTEEEGREKEDVADVCSGIRNADLDTVDEQNKSDEWGEAMEDQEVMEQEGATMYYTAVGDQCNNNNAEQLAGDAPTAIKDDSILGVSEDGVAGGLQEDEDGLVEGQCEDGVSVQDQHKVLEQCRNDELGVTMVVSRVHDLEEVVVGQEGVTEHFYTTAGDQIDNAALEQRTSDELRLIKDGNVVEDKEKAVDQEAAIDILGAAEDGIDVVLPEEDVVVEGQGEHAISVKDQDNVVEQGMRDELVVAMGESAVHDQEVVVVEQERVVQCFDATMEDQSNNAAMEQCTSDELREVKSGNVVEEKVKAVEQEDPIGLLCAADDGASVGEVDVAVKGQGEYDISVQDKRKVMDQCTSDELGVAIGGNTIQDHDVVVDLEEVTNYFDAVVEDQSNNAGVEQCAHDESKAFRGCSFEEVKKKTVQQEVVTEILGASRDRIAFQPQEHRGTVVEGQGDDGIFVQYQYKVVEQCTSDELEVAMGDTTVQDQEVAVEQEGTTEYAALQDHSKNTSVMQCTSDELSEVKDGNIVKIKEKALEKGEFAMLGAAENSVAVGLQGEYNMVVEGQGRDDISVQDQHKVLEQCSTDELGIAMGDSVVQDQEVAVLDLEGVTRCFDTAVEDPSNKYVVEQCTSDELEAAKDGNFVEEKEKAVVEEGAIDILGSAKDAINLGSQAEEEVVVMSEQDEDVVSLQDQYRVVEQCTSDQVRTATDVNATHEQKMVEQEGANFVKVATLSDNAIDAQEKAIEQSAGDESRATKDTEDKDEVVDQEGLIEQDAIKGGFAVESQVDEGMALKEQCEDGISVQDQDKMVEQCTSDQWRTTMDDNAAEDQEVKKEKIRLFVRYPQRSGRPNCCVYMSTGSCAYGLSCCYNHPQSSERGNREVKAKPEVPSSPSEQGNREVAQILELNRVGLPIRENARNCTYYMRNGTCRYGKRCCFNHPEHVLDVQLYKPTGWDDTNLPSSPHSKKSSSPHSKKSALDDISSSSEILPPNILRMFLPPQTVPPGAEAKETKVKKDPDWSSASDDSDGCCSADSSGGPLCKQEHRVDYSERPGRQECPFLLKYGDCKFASSCRYYHPNDKFARRNHVKDPSLAEEPTVYPDRPGAPECPFYMKTGTCKFGTECKFHHPNDSPPRMQGLRIPKRPVDAKELHPETKTTLQDNIDQQQNYPERPSQPECRYYMQFGKCKFLSACRFHHPKDRVLGMPECPFYMKTGTCRFGSACEFYHPKHRCSSKGGETDDGREYGHDYPERPGVTECVHYMKHGYCKFQMNCKYHHPPDRLSSK